MSFLRKGAKRESLLQDAISANIQRSENVCAQIAILLSRSSHKLHNGIYDCDVVKIRVAFGDWAFAGEKKK